jgi:hypothetical protein
VPIGEYHGIYTNDPAATLKNQIKFYCVIVMRNFERFMNVKSESEAFQFLIEASTMVPHLREYTEELVDPILNIRSTDYSQAFEKEFTIKKGKPPYFDPDFTGVIRQEFHHSEILIYVEWVAFKEKIYPLVIISSIRKVFYGIY